MRGTLTISAYSDAADAITYPLACLPTHLRGSSHTELYSAEISWFEGWEYPLAKCKRRRRSPTGYSPSSRLGSTVWSSAEILLMWLVTGTHDEGVKTFWGKICWELGLLNHTASDMHDISSAAWHLVDVELGIRNVSRCWCSSLFESILRTKAV